MSLHPAHVALIDDTGQISMKELGQYAAAFNQDVAGEFGSAWNARAIMAAYTEQDRPPSAWPMRIKAKLGQPGALGYHTDQQGQPVMYIMLTSTVTVTISHEGKEALADPYGMRMHPPAPLPRGLNPAQVGLSAGALVRYLVEVCDPPEAVSYNVLGIPQSDHILPAWYGAGGGPFSFVGGCTTSQQIADGGYCSFARADGEWFQVMNSGGSLQVSNLGKFSRGVGSWSIREWVDSKAREFRGITG